MRITVKEILEALNGKKIEYSCNLDNSFYKREITGFSALNDYKSGTLAWCQNEEYVPDTLKISDIEVLITGEENFKKEKNVIYTKNPKKAFFSVLEHFESSIPQVASIGEFSHIGENVILGQNVVIGSNCSIEGNIEIGDNTVIGNNVVIANNVIIGKECNIQSTSVIGEDGFGYIEDTEGKKMIRHYGGVVIGNNVFIGSHVNIARGTLSNTIVEDGAKISPSVHIGHNNRIGKNATVICSNLFGSVNVGDNTYLTACTVRNGVAVGSDTLIGMGAVVTKDIGTDQIAIGIPAKTMKKKG